MKKFLVFVVVLVVAGGALGYWRGWFSTNRDGQVDLQLDKAKFKQDKESFRKSVDEKAKSLKVKVASLWKKTEGLKGDEKAHAEKELGELKTKHDRLEQQIEELDRAGEDSFGTIKQDLTTQLDAVEKRIEELTSKMEKSTDK